MARPAKPHTRRHFLRESAALAVGAGAASTLSFAAPAVAQRPKLNYWCYQFLKESDDARANFAREWAQKNNVDLQITMVPLKEFLPKITAAIEAKATPDIFESNEVELRARGHLQEAGEDVRRMGGQRAQDHAGA
jgi:ABC-type glycerol-3-phosphate transport system substrate-binding protein